MITSNNVTSTKVTTTVVEDPENANTKYKSADKVINLHTAQNKEDDPGPMKTAHIVGIVIFVLVLITLIVYTYRRKNWKNKMLFKIHTKDEYDVDASNAIEMYERRSRSWVDKEDGVDHITGVVNPVLDPNEESRRHTGTGLGQSFLLHQK